jgi:hypothetical protein
MGGGGAGRTVRGGRLRCRFFRPLLIAILLNKNTRIVGYLNGSNVRFPEKHYKVTAFQGFAQREGGQRLTPSAHAASATRIQLHPKKPPAMTAIQ